MIPSPIFFSVSNVCCVLSNLMHDVYLDKTLTCSLLSHGVISLGQCFSPVCPAINDIMIISPGQVVCTLPKEIGQYKFLSWSVPVYKINDNYNNG